MMLVKVKVIGKYRGNDRYEYINPNNIVSVALTPKFYDVHLGGKDFIKADLNDPYVKGLVDAAESV